ncbi:MAG: hypothetical protein UV82_C0006G0069 [Candidatus Magasanikbacteria bacterium GW2011_GWD2_43_18]|uniref:YibE/F family protein n=1 Tax=Candidatus Magasanikbacteria bacterium GW2011_GWE2_42_7 TaxID=1619052 RepID=A0A0G1DMK9_9BACT|nr:MAG: hypothetical protein UV18_C0005G0017 [Candidatus Magasanikbacteria bacterium GW2011_GWC2_42_27]KKS72076.1 MAG: hypothetical protein UV42_C0014G0015 [Candidatus Magasanikbacteria bacterium GW2011_GWE2_42_7]KKT04713.1 MAG: hypothetical protein UV82_C0006G0069 [Candidatus Magasanikbacteria bacterium GW2011_GWD2_43_18]KKT24979.1 MAG: hypothetical protein UW10_C0016G0012 [Candidatus Magasanikbacteria bacterium GW2011_GWA2_43_9]
MKKMLILFFSLTLLLPYTASGAVTDPLDLSMDASPEIVQPTYYRGNILDVFEEIPRNEFGMFQQTVHVEMLSGPDIGKEISVSYETNPAQAENKKLKKGDTVILGIFPDGDTTSYYITDIYRLHALFWLIGFFILVAVLIARRLAAQAVLGLALSFGVIGWFILPRLLAGDSPVLISLLGAAAIMSVSIYLAHGIRTRTTIAFLCSIVTAAVGIFLASIFVRMTALFGMGSEEAFYLQFSVDTAINLRGLLLGGIIIGMLGVLDDVTTTQAATVEEIHLANPSLSTKELYRRGASVGKEHITSLINTLILAYTGAALPLLLLFRIYDTPAWVTLNSEIVMEELVRMIAGSMALMLAVPITTYAAARWYGREVTPHDAEEF